MERQTRTFPSMSFSVVMVIAVILTALPCSAADRSDYFVETGQPRELVNRPAYLTCESSMIRRCEIIDQ
jgi:hypothetical protein